MKALFVVVVVLLGSTSAANLRITNGQDAGRNEFPHQVSMQWGILGIWSHLCGGSIITPNGILTAAHCITESPSLGSFRIRAGILLLNEDVASRETIAVSSYVVHENYQGGVNPDDIAILRLASSLTYSAAIQPIALPQPGVVPTGNSVLSGWGSISTTNIANMPNTLQTAVLPLLTIQECASALTNLFGTSNPLRDTNVCTGPLFSAISACGGDSGGPLIQNGQVIGVVSWGVTPCGSPGAPTVYARTSSYIDWINRNIG